MNKAINIFKNKKKVSLAPLFSPIEKCERIKKVIPELPNLFIKRDDFIGSLVWGNKLRKLEYTLSDAEAKGADTILTYGGVQSNHARITAQVSKRMGFDCILIMNGDRPEKPTANFTIVDFLQIPIHYVSTRQERHPKMMEVAEQLKQQGKHPYCVPLGASDDIGSWGFVNAIDEVLQQQKELGVTFDYIIHSGSSGGTQAGMMVGKKLFELNELKIISVSADDPAESIRYSVMAAAQPMLQELGLPVLERSEVVVDENYFGDGYAVPTSLSSFASDSFAKLEGITLDGTYTSKAMAAVIDYSRKGMFQPTDNILFWHTGGLLNMFK